MTTNKLIEMESAKSIPRWHFPMLNDGQRNQAFQRAIESVDMRDKTVLDIGTGTGLLSMLAARNGASHVYACEVNPDVARMAAEIVANNGYSDRVTVINKLSTELVPGVDVPKDIDILISETVDCGFFGEGFVPSLAHAKSRLLKPDALLLPQSVRLKASLLSSRDVYQLNRVDRVLDFDVNLFNKFATPHYFPCRLDTWLYQLASPPLTVATASFYQDILFPSLSKVAFEPDVSTHVHGVVFWFELDLTDEEMLSNHPGNVASHWMQAVQIFSSPIEVHQGRPLPMLLSIGETEIYFSFT
ncbi:50S ribosomal protein L11 methyltransferase [Gynuella sp.]|uniref:50S ribosomal protein L11 methyltransferase n=1 Tax=Gynuella sp. TaxID=2969146 RepID=UPI003D0B933D